MEYIDWDPALTRAATGCHIGLMERNISVTGFRLVIIIIIIIRQCQHTPIRFLILQLLLFLHYKNYNCKLLHKELMQYPTKIENKTKFNFCKMPTGSG